MRRELRARATSLELVLGRVVPFGQVVEALVRGFSEALNLSLESEELSEHELVFTTPPGGGHAKLSSNLLTVGHYLAGAVDVTHSGVELYQPPGPRHPERATRVRLTMWPEPGTGRMLNMTPRLVLYDAAETPRAGLALEEDGDPSLRLADAKGEPLFSAP